MYSGFFMQNEPNSGSSRPRHWRAGDDGSRHADKLGPRWIGWPGRWGPTTFPWCQKLGGPFRYLENAECGMGKEKWQMTNARWQMTNAGTKRTTHVSRVPEIGWPLPLSRTACRKTPC